MLEEPPPEESRRARRSKSRSNPKSRRAAAPPEDDESKPLNARHARRLRAQRQRFWFVLMPAVAVALAFVVAIGVAIRDDSGDGSGAASSADGSAAARNPQTLLLAHRGVDGRIDLLTLTGSTSKAASVLLFPVATQVEVPSLGPLTLADLPADGDQELLATTVENLLGVKVAKTLVLDDAGLIAALDPAGPFTVDLHREVKFDGTSEGAITSGTHRISAADAGRLLVTAQPGSELDRLVTVQDVLDGWSLRLRVPSVARATLQTQPGLAAMVAAARASDRRTDPLPVESVTTGGSERFDPRPDEVARYAAAAFPNARLTIGGKRPRVEILNGTGAVGLAQAIAGRIVPAGGQVTLTGNVAKFGLTNTQVVYYRSEDRSVAQRLLKALGCGALKEADTAVGIVDVTILAGADCFPPGGTPSP